MANILKKRFFITLGIAVIIINSACRTTVPTKSVSKQLIISDVKLTMLYLPPVEFPGGPLGTIGLPEKRPDVIKIGKGVWLAETNTTYELWQVVYSWAIKNNYQFNRPGCMGTELNSAEMNNQHPVTRVDWVSAAIWCNALTELYNIEHNTNLMQVYEHKGKAISKPILRKNEYSIIANPDADGFRLPSANEWEFSARFSIKKTNETYKEYPKGSGNFWIPFFEVSGEPEYIADMADRGGNVEYGSIISKPVMELEHNDLGFTGFAGKDGKLWQWCNKFLLYRENTGDSFHLKRGGSRAPRCGRHEYWPRNKEAKTNETCNGFDQITFRVALTPKPGF